MPQGLPAEKTEGTPKKKLSRQDWIALGSVSVLFLCCIMTNLKWTGPPNWGSLEGTVVILDENGEPIPYRDTTFTFFSHYAHGFFRSETGRERNYCIDAAGRFGSDGPYPIPKFPATLFFHTRNGKYAAVVDLAEGAPTTGLVIELRPRYSAAGRLVDSSGTPLANYEFSLDFSRTPDFGGLPFGRKVAFVKTFEFVYCETDAEGRFTADRLIPGLEYDLRIHLPKTAAGYATTPASIKMPILSPEQYREPFSLGDVVVPRAVPFSMPPSLR